MAGTGSTKQFFAEDSAGGIGDLVVRAKTTVLREGSRALAAGLDLRLPTGDEQNLLGSGATGVRPFAAFSTSVGALAPHANIAYQWNGDSVLAGDVKTGQKASLPDQFFYAIGTDAAVNNHLTVIFDVIGQRVMDSPRLQVHTATFTGVAGSAALGDISFTTDSYWTTNASVGFKANVASEVLINFNLRFQVGKNGLADRISPLLGLEWGF